MSRSHSSSNPIPRSDDMTEDDRSHSIYVDHAGRVHRREQARMQNIRKDIRQAIKKVIARRFARCGPECIMSIHAIANLTRKQLDADGLESHWKLIPYYAEEVILETFSTSVWEKGPLRRRKYAVKEKTRSKKGG